jgi:hypothetical protein
LVVIVIGVLVTAAGVGLAPRLFAGEKVLSGLGPAFTPARVAGADAGVGFLSELTAMVGPLATGSGGAEQEIPRFLRLLARPRRHGQETDAQVLAALAHQFPQAAALIEAVPLTGVSKEIAPLLFPTLFPSVLSATPAISKAALALPPVTAGWLAVPGIGPLRRFSGAPVITWPQVVDYFAGDLVPLLEQQQRRFRALRGDGGVGFLAPLLIVLGLALAVYGVRMSGSRSRSRSAWTPVAAVGALVLILILALNLYSRMSSGQKLLDAARPAFTKARVDGDVAAMAYAAQVVLATDPLVLPGGAASEVPTFARLYASRTHLSAGAAAQSLNSGFPHLAALLRALPLSSVDSELPALISEIASLRHVSTPDAMLARIDREFPALGASLTALGPVVNGWLNVPGTAGLTRFDGQPAQSFDQVYDYLSGDLVAAFARQRGHFEELRGDWPRLTLIAPVLTGVGGVVLLYALVMVGLLSLARVRRGSPAPDPPE